MMDDYWPMPMDGRIYCCILVKEEREGRKEGRRGTKMVQKSKKEKAAKN
jgi:hypothetical protein